MKIIKKQKLPLVQCKYCKAVLKIKHKDIIYSNKSGFYGMQCKCCNKVNKFSTLSEIIYNEDWENYDE